MYGLGAPLPVANGAFEETNRDGVENEAGHGCLLPHYHCSISSLAIYIAVPRVR